MSGPSPDRAANFTRDQFAHAAKPKAKKQKRPSPVSIRFSVQELERLKAEAGARSLNGHIRHRLFGTATKTRRAPSSARPDAALLSQLLRNLGEWDLTWALKELELTVDEGVIVLDIETCDAVRGACADIAAMRQELMRALGLRNQTSR
ncbi:MAG: hypothetical protein ACE360_11240 [Hyphomicrobiales bacterium]